MKKVTAIILAGGSGLRMKTATPKQFLKIAGKPVIIHTIEQFEKSDLISDIVVVCAKGYINNLNKLIKKSNIKKIYKVVPGGKTRQNSSFIGLKKCPPKTAFVLIHDAIRPFVNKKIIKDTLRAAKEVGAAVAVMDVTDTIIVKKGAFIEKMPNRKKLKRVQTPQGFEYKIILNAHRNALKNGITNTTDDCSLVLPIGQPVKLITGSVLNIKLTNQPDLYLAEKLFQLQRKKL